jgi:hypothetical protein
MSVPNGLRDAPIATTLPTWNATRQGIRQWDLAAGVVRLVCMTNDMVLGRSDPPLVIEIRIVPLYQVVSRPQHLALNSD